MLPQFKAMERPSAALVEQGIFLILSGLFKKVVIADRLNIYVNTIFEGPSLYPSLACILAALLFTVQLYCDFAGYSEIAIGTTNLFGFPAGAVLLDRGNCEENAKGLYFRKRYRGTFQFCGPQVLFGLYTPFFGWPKGVFKKFNGRPSVAISRWLLRLGG